MSLLWPSHSPLPVNKPYMCLSLFTCAANPAPALSAQLKGEGSESNLKTVPVITQDQNKLICVYVVSDVCPHHIPADPIFPLFLSVNQRAWRCWQVCVCVCVCTVCSSLTWSKSLFQCCSELLIWPWSLNLCGVFISVSGCDCCSDSGGEDAAVVGCCRLFSSLIVLRIFFFFGETQRLKFTMVTSHLSICQR